MPQGNTLNCVSFITPVVGWAVGNDGTILKTTNGGTSWTSQSIETSVPLYSVSFTDSDNGTVVGDVGTILRTTDGGTTWSSLEVLYK